MTVRGRRRCGCRWLWCGWIAAGGPALLSARAETVPPHYQIAAVGSDSYLWIAIGESSSREKGYKNWLAYHDKTSSELHALPGPLPQAERIKRIASAGLNLHVFYDDGTHYRYTVPVRASRGSPPISLRRELRLP